MGMLQNITQDLGPGLPFVTECFAFPSSA